MTAFYAETGTPMDASLTRRAFTRLIEEDALGRVWLLEAGAEVAGYAVLTLGFSLEYGGRDAFLDDLYVSPGHRGRGLGRTALDAVVAECRLRGVRALHLEVARDNAPAHALYARFGFVSHDRTLMTRPVRPETD